MWIFGSNCSVEDGGIGGFNLNIDPTISCLSLAGVSNKAVNMRYVDHAGPAVYIADFAETSTRGITIDEMHIIQAGRPITGITKANPAVVTYSGADIFTNGMRVEIAGAGGMTEINNRAFTVANLNAAANTFELSGLDSTAFTTYTSGGVVRRQLDPAIEIAPGADYVAVSSFDRANIWNLQRQTDGKNVPGAVHQRPELCHKRASQTVNNSSALVNDDDLSFPIESGESVLFKAVIAHVGDATADFKCTFAGPTGCTIRWGPTGAQENIGGTIVQYVRSTEGVTASFGGATSARIIEFSGVAKAGNVGGTVSFQWAQNTPTVVNTQVLGGNLGGSHLLVWRE